MSKINWTEVLQSYLATLSAVITLYLIYRLFGHDMIGLK
jgi:hypothetical protein